MGTDGQLELWRFDGLGLFHDVGGDGLRGDLARMVELIGGDQNAGIGSVKRAVAESRARLLEPAVDAGAL